MLIIRTTFYGADYLCNLLLRINYVLVDNSSAFFSFQTISVHKFKIPIYL